MLVVADTSVLVPALTKFDGEGNAARSFLNDLADGRELQILKNFSQLEFLSAMRRLNANRQLSDEGAMAAIKRFVELPAKRREVTQPMAIRIWELRNNHSAYDGAFIALTERLTSIESTAVLATADAKLCASPTISIQTELFSYQE